MLYPADGTSGVSQGTAPGGTLEADDPTIPNRLALRSACSESTESWADLLRSAKRRGMVAPVLAAGDGALGFWAALREEFSETVEQRCWFHYADVQIMPMWLGLPLLDRDFGLAWSA